MTLLHFCLTIYHLTTFLFSAFHLFHFDNGLVGERYDVVLQDLNLVKRAVTQLGLQLSAANSVVICKSLPTFDKFWQQLLFSM